MSKVEAVRRALLEIGPVSHEELAEFVTRQYGVKLDPRLVPVIRSTVKDRNLLDRRRPALCTARGQRRAA